MYLQIARCSRRETSGIPLNLWGWKPAGKPPGLGVWMDPRLAYALVVPGLLRASSFPRLLLGGGGGILCNFKPNVGGIWR